MSTVVRLANATDMVEIHNIEQVVAISPWSLTMFQSCNGNRNHNLVIEVDGTIAGYCFLEHIAGEVIINNIAVSSAYQGKGLANQLMAATFDYAKSINGFQMLLEVRASNVIAISLYNKFGFEQVGVRKGYYANGDGSKEDAVLMNCPLQTE